MKEYEPGWCPYCGEPEHVCGGRCGLSDYPDWLEDDDDPRTVDEICEPLFPHEKPQGRRITPMKDEQR